MRIARFAKGDGVAYGVVEGESGQPQTIAELYGHPFGVDPAGVRFTGNRYPLAEVRLLAPVLPSKVVAVGKNYAEHVKEMGRYGAARRAGPVPQAVHLGDRARRPHRLPGEDAPTGWTTRASWP